MAQKMMAADCVFFARFGCFSRVVDWIYLLRLSAFCWNQIWKTVIQDGHPVELGMSNYLVGGFNPSSPNRDENKKYLKPPPNTYLCYFYVIHLDAYSDFTCTYKQFPIILAF